MTRSCAFRSSRGSTGPASRCAAAVLVVVLSACSSPPPNGSGRHPDGPEPPVARDALVAAVEEDARFAGVWTDENGVFHVAVTRDADEIRMSVNHLVPRGMQVVFDTVRYSYLELQEVKDRIVDENDMNVTLVAVDPASNRVHVGIHPFNPQEADELVRRYGRMIEVFHRPPQTQR
jgi:hypothetical protein